MGLDNSKLEGGDGSETGDGTGLPRKGPLGEFSVIYTERTYNLMAPPFQESMVELGSILKRAYNAEHVALVPGAGTFAMEAAARAFGKGKKCLVIRLGFFSFRWTQILEMGELPAEDPIVMMARPTESNSGSDGETGNGKGEGKGKGKGSEASAEEKGPQFEPPGIEEVVAKIKEYKPAVVFAPHVETSVGMMLRDDYILQVGEACKEVGAIFVLDSIASGPMWIDMKKLNVDVLITAPQKGWSGPCSVGVVMMNDRTKEYLKSSQSPPSSSFSCDLKKWLEVMEKYESGGFMYHTTLPTDAIMAFRDAAKETEKLGLEEAKKRSLALGRQVREILKSHGFQSVAAKGYHSPGVIVVYDNRKESEGQGTMPAAMKKQNMMIAGGVPFKLGKPSEGLYPTFRIGLFGLDKWRDVDVTVKCFQDAFQKALEQ